MAAPICQFVDRVGTGAVQRLNLNDGKNLTLLLGPDFPGPDFSPPPLKRAVVNTLLTEGASIPASAYDNRVIRLPLRVTACDEAEMATVLESLHRELDRERNVLKWQPTYNSRPVYFRTFRSPDYLLDQTWEGRAELRQNIAILAEPFAYGERIDGGPFTISNDPVNANGQLLNISNVPGDVPTPLWVRTDNLIPNNHKTVVAVRRHGTPASMTWFYQCEAMTQGIDTAIQANDAAMSGAGNNWSRTTFATNANLVTRLSVVNVFPAAGPLVDQQGLYRVFARCRIDSGVGTVNGIFRLQMIAQSGGSVYEGEIVTWDHTAGAGAMGLRMFDFNILLPIPLGAVPDGEGYDPTELAVQGISIYLQAARDSGDRRLDWDYIVLVPADEELMAADLLLISNPNPRLVIDGPQDMLYLERSIDGQLQSTPSIPRVGAIPLLAPNQTNRISWLPSVNELPAGVDILAFTWTVYTSYWPRYLYIR